MRKRKIRIRHLTCDRLAQCPLLLRIDIGVQQADRDGLATFRLEMGDGLGHRFRIKRFVLGTGREQATVDFTRQRARNQRPGALKEQIVGLRPVAAPDGVDIARAARDDQACACALALDQRVDRGGGPVDQLGNLADGDPALVQAVNDALHQIARRRQAFSLQEALRLRIEADQIREGAADVDCYDDHARRLLSCAPQALIFQPECGVASLGSMGSSA